MGERREGVGGVGGGVSAAGHSHTRAMRDWGGERGWEELGGASGGDCLVVGMGWEGKGDGEGLRMGEGGKRDEVGAWFPLRSCGGGVAGMSRADVSRVPFFVVVFLSFSAVLCSSCSLLPFFKLSLSHTRDFFLEFCLLLRSDKRRRRRKKQTDVPVFLCR